MPIVIRVKGGLGNQLFQYAIGRHLALLRGEELVLDLTPLLDPATPVRRMFDLSVFRPTLKCTLISRLAGRLPVPRLYNATAQAITLLKHTLGIQRLYLERSTRFDPNVFQVSADAYLDGYWQSELYFTDIADIIRQDVKITPQDSDVLALANLAQSSGAVAIHVRRTDYVNVASSVTSLGFVGVEYYQRALAALRPTAGLAPLLVFSDDIAWCRRHLSSLLWRECLYVDKSSIGASTPSVDLWLMSQCRYFVISNSTFAWWAAWLSRTPDKIVIAPWRWFGNPRLDSTDIVPATWIRV